MIIIIKYAICRLILLPLVISCDYISLSAVIFHLSVDIFRDIDFSRNAISKIGANHA